MPLPRTAVLGPCPLVGFWHKPTTSALQRSRLLLGALPTSHARGPSLDAVASTFMSSRPTSVAVQKSASFPRLVRNADF